MSSQFEILKKILTDSKFNWIKVNYKGKAKGAFAAWVRKETGQTVDHVKKSHFMAERMTSSNSPSMLLTMARDTGSRNDKDEFDFRSLRIAEIDPVSLEAIQHVDSVEVCNNFETWKTIDLNGLPVFPAIADKEAEAIFVSHLNRLRKLEAKKDVLSKRLTALKKKIAKSGVEQMAHKFFYQPPSGTAEKIVNKATGEAVKQTRSDSPRLQLHPVNIPHYEVEDYTTDDVVKLHLTIQEIAENIKTLQHDIRPSELGVMERVHGDPQAVLKLQGVEFKIDNKAGSSYDWTQADRDKVESGEYEIKEIPVSRGRWVCEEIPVPSSPAIKETETEVTV